MWKSPRFFHVITKLHSGGKIWTIRALLTLYFANVFKCFFSVRHMLYQYLRMCFVFQILYKYWIVATMLVLVSISYGLLFTVSIYLWMDVVWKNVAKMNYKLQCLSLRSESRVEKYCILWCCISMNYIKSKFKIFDLWSI